LGDFYEVIGNPTYFTGLNFTISSTYFGITAGMSYTLRYRAMNIYGWSDFSDVTIV